jgi:hypothetical protein
MRDRPRAKTTLSSRLQLRIPGIDHRDVFGTAEGARQDANWGATASDWARGRVRFIDCGLDGVRLLLFPEQQRELSNLSITCAQ